MAERRTRTPRSGPLADFVGDLLSPSLRRRGFQSAEIVTHWSAIVGDRIAGATLPEKIAWPRGANGDDEQPRPPATLVVRVDGPVAIEIQHMSDQVLERINAYFGFRAVGKLRFVQAPLPRVTKELPVRAACSDEDARAVDVLVEPVENDRLREALAALGRNVAANVNKA